MIGYSEALANSSVIQDFVKRAEFETGYFNHKVAIEALNFGNPAFALLWSQLMPSSPIPSGIKFINFSVLEHPDCIKKLETAISSIDPGELNAAILQIQVSRDLAELSRALGEGQLSATQLMDIRTIAGATDLDGAKTRL